MKKILWSLFVLSFFIMSLHIIGCVNTYYKYQNDIGSFWELADKSSSLIEKSKYIDKFLNALKKSKHSEYNAVIYKTPTLNFDNNIKALESLKERLDAIKYIDQKSFAYQTAIQQITGQEQGEAKEMLLVFNGCWELENYWYVWSWYCGIIITIYVLLFSISTLWLFTLNN